LTKGLQPTGIAIGIPDSFEVKKNSICFSRKKNKLAKDLGNFDFVFCFFSVLPQELMA